jgi:predicted Zn finger-like uncharacterized protein
MDIKCERCGTEYEFDDERVTEEGVTVKCSTCGHLFKVRKKSFVLTEPVVLGKKGGQDDAGRNWMVRRGDGTILSFKELTTLQKWIVERKVSREDEISKSGETWKRLGSIAELASFFQVVDQASSAESAPAPQTSPGLQIQPKPETITQPLPAATPAQAAVPAPSAPTPIDVPSSPPPAMTPPLGSPVAPAIEPEAPVMPDAPVSTAAPAQATSPGIPQAPPQPAEAPSRDLQLGTPAVDTRSEPDSWGDPDMGDSDDVVEKWKKRGRRKWYFIVPLLLIVAGLGGWYLLSKETFMQVYAMITGRGETLPGTAVTRFEAGYGHFFKDSSDELAAAIGDLTAAIEETKGNYPLAMATLAEVHITRADKGNQQIKRMDAQIADLVKQVDALKPKDGKEPGGKLLEQITPLHNKKVGIQKERMKVVDAARKDLDEAKRLIDAARGLDPKAFAPKRALADYLRVMSGDRAHLEEPLAEAASLNENDPGLLYVDGASLASDPAMLEAAAGKLQMAIDLQHKAGKPDFLRARCKLAEVLIGLGKQEEAKIQIDQILRENPKHEEASQLLAELAPKAEPEPEPEAEPDKKPAEPGAPTTYQGWMTLANGLQQKGQTRKALQAYDSALELKPEDSEALTGKGICFLDDGAYGAAINWFHRALKSNSRHADAIMGLAEAYKYRGDNPQAVRFYQRYLEAFPAGPEAAVARRNLKELK